MHRIVYRRLGLLCSVHCGSGTYLGITSRAQERGARFMVRHCLWERGWKLELVFFRLASLDLLDIIFYCC